MVDIENMGLL